jgi:hypothetical protein
MDRQHDDSSDGFGLVAFGSSGRWEVSIDESREREGEWIAEIEDPRLDLVFQLRDLRVVHEALDFLQLRYNKQFYEKILNKTADCNNLTLGQFGPSPVSLVWDDEEFVRCFLIVGPGAKSTMRFSLYIEDIEMLIDALQQAIADIPSDP